MVCYIPLAAQFNADQKNHMQYMAKIMPRRLQSILRGFIFAQKG